MVLQQGGQSPKPAQRFSKGAFLLWAKKLREKALPVRAVSHNRSYPKQSVAFASQNQSSGGCFQVTVVCFRVSAGCFRVTAQGMLVKGKARRVSILDALLSCRADVRRDD